VTQDTFDVEGRLARAEARTPRLERAIEKASGGGTQSCQRLSRPSFKNADHAWLQYLRENPAMAKQHCVMQQIFKGIFTEGFTRGRQ
jgi:hypothetical protein